MGYEYEEVMTSNPLILRGTVTMTSTSKLIAVTWFLRSYGLFRDVMRANWEQQRRSRLSVQ